MKLFGQTPGTELPILHLINPLLLFPLFSVAVTLTTSLDVVIHSQLFSTLDASTSAHINIALPPQELLNEGMSLKSLHYPSKGTKSQEAPLQNWCCRYQISVPPVLNSRFQEKFKTSFSVL